MQFESARLTLPYFLSLSLSGFLLTSIHRARDIPINLSLSYTYIIRTYIYSLYTCAGDKRLSRFALSLSHSFSLLSISLSFPFPFASYILWQPSPRNSARETQVKGLKAPGKGI